MRLRRFTAAAALCAVLLGMSPRAHARFFDVPPDHPYFTAIHFLLTNGIIHGYENRSYRPENAITRAEFTKILVSVLFPAEYIDTCIESLPEASPVIPSFNFPDVPRDTWFAPFVCTAWINGIVSGYPDGQFRPEEGVKVVEAAKMLTLGFQLSALELPDLGEQNVLWYRPYVEFLEQQNAIPPTIKDVRLPLLRGEMAEMIYRMKDYPLALEPVSDFSLRTEDVVYPLTWVTHKDTTFGIAFDYPGVWEQPLAIPRGTARQMPIARSAWTLYFGPEPERCVGSQRCIERDMWIDGYDYDDVDDILDAIEFSPSIVQVVDEPTIGELTAVVFYEKDGCNLKRAFIFGERQIYGLAMRCGMYDNDISHTFDRVLRSFREIRIPGVPG